MFRQHNFFLALFYKIGGFCNYLRLYSVCNNWFLVLLYPSICVCFINMFVSITKTFQLCYATLKIEEKFFWKLFCKIRAANVQRPFQQLAGWYSWCRLSANMRVGTYGGDSRTVVCLFEYCPYCKSFGAVCQLNFLPAIKLHHQQS